MGKTLIIGRNLTDINRIMLVMIVMVFAGNLIDVAFFRSIEKYVYKKRGL